MVCHEVGLRRAGSSIALTGDIDGGQAALLVARSGVDLSRRGGEVSVDARSDAHTFCGTLEYSKGKE